MSDLQPVLQRFAPLDGLSPTRMATAPMAGGLINDTFALGDSWVLQRLHRIFRAEVNLDISALVPHVLAAGVPVPVLQPALDGRPWTELREPSELAGVWRVMTRLDGDTLHKLAQPSQAHSAAALLGRFHGALAPVAHSFAFTRPGAHDTDKHMATLVRALEDHTRHRLHRDVAQVADELLGMWRDCPRAVDLPERIIHGDAKVSNFLFRQDSAVAVLDLDTMAHGTLDIELGDALRSWCNPTSEDAEHPSFDATIFAAVVQGYGEATRDWLTPSELRSLPMGALRICLELSARFAADALNESYFGWNSSRYGARGEHNLARAQCQLKLAQDLARQWTALEAIVSG